MPVNFLALPAYHSPDAPMQAWNMLGQGFDAIREGKKDSRLLDIKQQAQDLDKSRFGLEQKRFGLEEQKIKSDLEAQWAKRFGGVAQMWLDEKDPARQAQMFQQFSTADPRVKAAISKTLPAELHNDPVAVGRYLTAIAQGYMSPQEKAQLEATRANTAHTLAAESRAQALHPYDVQMKQKAVEESKYGTLKENERLFLKEPGGPRFVDHPGAGLQGPYKDMKQRADVEESLRKEVTTYAKDYTTIRNSTANLEAIAKSPSAASDIAMIYSFMKILDPGSVVRETEYATAQNAAGVPERVQGIWNRLLNGERLSDAQRADFLRQAQTLAVQQRRFYETRLNQYHGIAKRVGVDPSNVILVEPESSANGRPAPTVNGGPVGARGVPMPDAPAAATVPAEAITELKRDPSPLRQKQFDEVFGAGAAQRALGGR